MEKDRIEFIGRSLEELKGRIRDLALAAGREPDGVRLVAVSKGFPAGDVSAALSFGQRVFGENRAQELVGKSAELERLGLGCDWHMIGRLQTNKVKQVIGLASLIHSVDRVRLLDVIQRQAQARGMVQPVLLQVNISQEATKQGFGAEEVEAVLAAAEDYPNIEIRGLMTMAPFYDDPEDARPIFRQLRHLRDRLADPDALPAFTELSMGMTQDYAQAVEEGATLLRIGSALFGAREP